MRVLEEFKFLYVFISMNIFPVIRKGRREKRTWDLRGVLELRDPC